ncbi:MULTISPECIES: hypothetical protein [Stenotrophomonas]|uniref:ATP nucleosidase Cap17-like N-terminal domain-containing protein n=1 Tax=Stenotrophomonas rhizophila TaxID=216778 RepID=A0A7V7YJC0_9GAMM|nr:MULTISPECIES: hypothetical protein [Stenotrophomonas]KAB7632192.1 hypothetical protein F9K92_02915 [Stenotrophomonas rhizophila]
MAPPSLLGRRIHIAGSISKDSCTAAPQEVERARQSVELLVKELVARGAAFVVPIDAEKPREDGLPICFDWLVLKTIFNNLASRPASATGPLVFAVKHHKNEDQIPEQYEDLWATMRSSDLVQIESAAHWNMNAKRMEAQARHGDILITLGGGEGVLFLANLYHDAGKPVVPLTFKLESATTGSQKIFDFASTSNNAKRLFLVEGAPNEHGWLNRIEVTSRKAVADCVKDVIGLVESLVPPRAFVVRLLNPSHPDFESVESFFDNVVQPVMENELGYRLTVVDGRQSYDHARIDEEIFAKLHRSRVVLADITGGRPNCFIELGYALGRGLPTMLMAKEGSDHPFDITTLSGHHWKPTGSTVERRKAFLEHWNAIRNRPSLVPTEPLIP